MKLTDEEVGEIIRILESSDYGELELETERFRLVLHRESGRGWSRQQETLAEAEIALAETELPAEQATQTAVSPAAEDAGDAAAEDWLEVRAPIVGIFYRARAPGETPFVEVGSRVEPDTVVAIIEVMKLMNSVPAGVSGEVVDICVDNAAGVKQGEVLMRVRPQS